MITGLEIANLQADAAKVEFKILSDHVVSWDELLKLLNNHTVRVKEEQVKIRLLQTLAIIKDILK